jgi:hypothetical protein
MSERIHLKLFILRAVLCLCGLAAVGTIFLQGYSTFFGAPKLSHQLIATVAAPSGKLTAVLTRISGAQDSGYLVDVNAPDGETERVANFYGVRKIGGTVGLDMAWQGDHTLELHYQRATLARLDQSDLTVAGQHVIVRLKSQP